MLQEVFLILKKDSFIITERIEVTSLKGFFKDTTKIAYNFNTIKEPVYQIYHEVAPLQYQCINCSGFYDSDVNLLFKHIFQTK